MTTETVDARYDSVQRRDPTATFIFGVRTTCIACRPGCPSRTPRPENVCFFDDYDAARAAGFRACKRCAPDDVAADADRRRLVARACALLDANDAMSLDAIGRAVGVSRFHFHRIFRVVTGVTPGDYRRARREGRLRESLANGVSVADAIYAAGYSSPSRAYEGNALGMTPTAFRAGAPGERIAYAIGDSRLGRVLVAITAVGVCAIALGDDDAAVLASLRRDFPNAALIENDAELARNLATVLHAIDGDASGEDRSGPLELDLDIRGTAFRRRVWHALRAIPPGERLSYSDLAASIGQPGAARAVAGACAANPIAIAVPCHRVVGSDGALRGYRWGLDRKAELLRREARSRA